MELYPVKLICHKNSRRRGIMLIECLVYLALFAVVLGFAYGAWDRCVANSKRLNQNVDDVVRALQAGERWRDDVRAAKSVEISGESLRLAQSNSVIEYVFDGQSVLRREKADAPLVKFLPRVKLSRMEADARSQVRAWSWIVELSVKPGADRFHPLFSFEAVPAGSQTP